jgi:Predicted transcriptional regulators
VKRLVKKVTSGRRGKLKTPYKDLLPPLKTSEREALAADIAMNGVMHPVVIDEDDNILDGHHRYEIDPGAPTYVVTGLVAVATDLALSGKIGLSIAYLGYAFANVGLWMAAQ